MTTPARSLRGDLIPAPRQPAPNPPRAEATSSGGGPHPQAAPGESSHLGSGATWRRLTDPGHQKGRGRVTNPPRLRPLGRRVDLTTLMEKHEEENWRLT